MAGFQTTRSNGRDVKWSSPQTAITTSPAGRKAGPLEPSAESSGCPAEQTAGDTVPQGEVARGFDHVRAACRQGTTASFHVAHQDWQSDRASAPGEVVDDGLESPILPLRAGQAMARSSRHRERAAIRREPGERLVHGSIRRSQRPGGPIRQAAGEHASASFAARSCVPSAENATELAEVPLCGCIGIIARTPEDGPVRSTPRIPEPDRAITAGGRQRAAVGSERDAPDSTRMSEERDLRRSRREVPDPKARLCCRPRRACGHRERTPGCK